MKYIDAKKLKVLIQQLIGECIRNNWSTTEYCLRKILSVIDSLQQEQPEVDLGEEINRFWDSCIKHKNERGSNVIWSNKLEVEVLARHFYELGVKTQKGE